MDKNENRKKIKIAPAIMLKHKMEKISEEMDKSEESKKIEKNRMTLDSRKPIYRSAMQCSRLKINYLNL